jgi:hypothetical protein
MANSMLSTLIHTLAELKDSSHLHKRPVGDKEASEWSRERHPAKMEPIGPHAFLWAGFDQGSLRNRSQGVSGTGKLKESKRFHGLRMLGGSRRGGGGVHTDLYESQLRGFDRR